jgi:hypothetical protein
MAIFKRRPDDKLPAWNRLLTQLEAAGFYRYAPQDAISEAKTRALETGYLFDESTRRVYWADAEDLAEGGVLEFIDTVEPFLVHQGAKILSKDQDFVIGGAYSVRINGKWYPIYSADECEKADIWTLSSQRTYRMINDLLAGTKSDERVYLLYGGNDALAVFLTEQIYKILRDTALIDERDKPVDWG